MSTAAHGRANRVSKLVGRAVFSFGMIEPGDRILVGISGGKDSLVLLDQLSARRRILPFDFDVQPVHIRSDFAPADLDAALGAVAERWGAPIPQIPVAIRARLQPGRHLDCYWCATQRRLELIDYALKHGYTAVALGHHLDDILETLLMNMVSRGVLSTMLPHLRYERYPLRIIRPLCLVDERSIVELVQTWGFSGSVCSCPFAPNGDRRAARAKLEVLTDGSYRAKRRLFDSLSNVRAQYLPNPTNPVQ